MHRPVLLEETIWMLNLKPDGFYVDGTVGLGGHAVEIAKRLGPSGRLLGLDVDATTLKVAESRLQPFGNMAITRQVNFRGLQRVLQELGWNEVDGMLFDLGLSSVQLDDPNRGFSFQREGPLDMRLDPKGAETALTILQKINESTLINTLKTYGEPRYAVRLTKRILSDVTAGRLKTTQNLAEICESEIGRRGKIHPATRVFLALRSLVNQEERSLSDLLTVAPNMLRRGGRLVIITFQSVEDRSVKESFRSLAVMESDEKQFSVITKKPIEPSEQEQRENPRSRSAKLRVLERIK